METLQLKLSLAGLDTPEDKLRELQIWLQDAGIFVKLEIEPPAEEEMGGKVTALILAFSLVSEFGHRIQNSKWKAVIHAIFFDNLNLLSILEATRKLCQLTTS